MAAFAAFAAFEPAAFAAFAIFEPAAFAAFAAFEPAEESFFPAFLKMLSARPFLAALASAAQQLSPAYPLPARW